MAGALGKGKGLHGCGPCIGVTEDGGLRGAEAGGLGLKTRKQ
jgi:hypothetical protein